MQPLVNLHLGCCVSSQLLAGSISLWLQMLATSGA